MLNLNVNDFCTVESNRKSLVLPSIILSIDKYRMKAKTLHVWDLCLKKKVGSKLNK